MDMTGVYACLFEPVCDVTTVPSHLNEGGGEKKNCTNSHKKRKFLSFFVAVGAIFFHRPLVNANLGGESGIGPRQPFGFDRFVVAQTTRLVQKIAQKALLAVILLLSSVFVTEVPY